MKSFSMRSFTTFLSRNRLYTAVNVFGLSVSLAFVILIGDLVRRQLTVDDFQANADRIYLMGSEVTMGSAYRLSNRLLSRYPEIEKITAAGVGYNVGLEVEGRKTAATILFADTTFFDIFSFELAEGDARHALDSRDNAVISESFARRMFGDSDPSGRTVLFTAEGLRPERAVSGIVKDWNNSIIPSADIIVRAENMEFYNASTVAEDLTNAGGVQLFLLARQGADLQAKASDMEEYFKEFYWPYAGGAWKKVVLMPLKDAYFDSYGTLLNSGDRRLTAVLLWAGLAILVFALINYVNLTVAQTGFRAKEMAARRLLGATRSEIFGRFMLESTLVCGAAFLLGFMLAVAVQGKASELLGERIDPTVGVTPAVIGVYAAFVIILGAASGVVPAVLVSRCRPVDAVRGTHGLRYGMRFGKAFIVFQNIIAVVLLSASVTMTLQVHRLFTEPLGYDAEDILDVRLFSGFRDYGGMRTFREETRKLACVEDVALACGTPADMGNNETRNYGTDRMISFQVYIGDSAYFRMLGLHLLRDNCLGGAGVFVNRQAIRELGIPEDSPSFKWGRNMEHETSIAGVYRDFRIGSSLMDYTPAILINVGDFDRWVGTQGDMPWSMLVKVRGDRKEAYDAVKGVYGRLTGGEPFYAEFMDAQVEEAYAPTQRVMKSVWIFTLVAIVISALGLLAMSTYYTRRRIAEIAVRRVYGSTRGEALGRLIRGFMLFVGAAFVLAVPLAWYILEQWLRGYSVRVSISPLIFIAAGVFTGVVALAAVWWQSSKGAGENPAEVLRK